MLFKGQLEGFHEGRELNLLHAAFSAPSIMFNTQKLLNRYEVDELNKKFSQYIERGLQPADLPNHFDEILNKIDEIITGGTWRDPKSYFQELTQRIDGQVPTYKLLTEEGPDHDKHFTVGLIVDGKMVSQGEGHSKQEAQTNAARAAIEIYKQRED